MSSNKRAAFDEWKNGTRHFPIDSQDDFNYAIQHFKKAIELDDRYARAYGWLAYTYVTGHIDAWGFPRSTPRHPLVEARKLADQAVSFDPVDYDTWWANAFVRLHTGDPVGAEVYFKEARALNYGNRELLGEMADERVYAGDYDQAIRLIERARSIPNWQRWVLAWAYYFKAQEDAGYYQMALDELNLIPVVPSKVKKHDGVKNPAEIHILEAAIHGQMSRGEGSKVEIKNHRESAKKNRLIYEGKRGWRRLDDIEGTNPFKSPADKDHWLSGLKVAGFSNTRPKKTKKKTR